MGGPYNQEVFNTLLTDGMKAQQVSQRQLAKRLEVSQQLVSKWLTGKSKPSPTTTIEAAQVLELDELELLRAVGYLPLDIDPELGVTVIAAELTGEQELDRLKKQLVALMNRVNELEEIVASSTKPTTRPRAARGKRPSK